MPDKGEHGDKKRNRPRPRVHRIVTVPVIYHDDGEVCPLSRGATTCPSADPATGKPFFDDPADADRDDIPDLRRLAGCYEAAARLERLSAILPAGFAGGLARAPVSWDDGVPVAPDLAGRTGKSD